MPPAARNLVNLKDVGKTYSSREILHGITLGIGAGERIGVVGRNGDGKSTLLRLIAGVESPDAGKVTRAGGLRVAMLGQTDDLEAARTVREELIGDLAEHEWAGDAAFREILDGLLGWSDAHRLPDNQADPQRPPDPLDRRIATLSGGERRRVALAKVLLEDSELLILDEPTNHLDVEGVHWLAEWLIKRLARRDGSLLVVTHDRWFLDAVCEQTWEVVDGTVHQYEGGYAAFVLARAERDRQGAASDTRRRALVRKELAWLRRGPPARTTKAKFRVDAANELIADEPPPRNSVQLLQFATARLGNRVIDAINISFDYDERPLLSKVTWRLAPGDRIGLVGVNGAGKTTLLKLMAGHIQPSTGSVKRGQTVRVAELSQDTSELPEHLNVFEALEDARIIATLSEGKEITAKQLCDRFGFAGGRARTLVSKLSGGERRRLQLMRLLMEEPNVLMLDEPTNDLDIDTLTALEDLLDSWPGTLIVVSHDRYFIERVCDNVYGLMGDGALRHLGGGIEQYVKMRHSAHEQTAQKQTAQKQTAQKQTAQKQTNQRRATSSPPTTAANDESARPTGAEVHAARKQLRRIDVALEKSTKREEVLHTMMAEAATDHERLRELQTELAKMTAERDRLEGEWLVNTEIVDG